MTVSTERFRGKHQRMWALVQRELDSDSLHAPDSHFDDGEPYRPRHAGEHSEVMFGTFRFRSRT